MPQCRKTGIEASSKLAGCIFNLAKSPSWLVKLNTSVRRAAHKLADEPPPPRPSAISSLFSAAEGTSTKFRYQGSTPAFSNPIQQKPPPTSTHTGLQRLMDESNRRRLKAQQSQTSSSKELSRYNNSAMLTQQISRRFKAGDVYAPHDLSEVEMAKWKKREKPNHDVFDLLDFKPAEHYKVRVSQGIEKES